jgi:hypothetical protein
MPSRDSAAAAVWCLHALGGDCAVRHRARHRLRLRQQATRAWLALATLLSLGAAAVCGAIQAAAHGFIVLAALGFTALVLMIGRAVHRLLVVRAQLRELARREPVLPRAVLYRGQARGRAGYPISSA